VRHFLPWGLTLLSLQAAALTPGTFGQWLWQQQQFLSSFAKRPTRPVPLPPGYVPQVDADTDPRLPVTLNNDYLWMQGLRLDFRQVSDVGDAYTAAFGGPQSTQVLKYLRDRVRYVTVESDWRGRTATGASGRKVPLGLVENIGTSLWIEGIAEGNFRHVKFRDQELIIESPRVGLVALLPGFAKAQTAAQRLGTLVHEARHSDCTGGLEPTDAKLVHDGQAPTHRECGHFHARCPKGHDLEGYYACDDHPWSAYEMDYLFYSTIANACTNCSTVERQVALIASFNSRTRLVHLPTEEGPWDPLHFHAPDMGSLNRLRAIPERIPAS
jgi:hypothetical protein